MWKYYGIWSGKISYLVLYLAKSTFEFLLPKQFFFKGKPDYNQKDENGKKLSKQYAEHMSQNRARCNECGVNFWVNWEVDPYHLGKTCEEFENFKDSIKCRFWGNPISYTKGDGVFSNVCDDQECIDKIDEWWDQTLDWGHPCKGFANEQECLPCLHPDCVEQNPDLTLNENDESYCAICFISGIGDSPSIQLGCRHIFHVDCILEKVRQKWSGPRITFLFKTCPSWKSEIDVDHHPELSELLSEANKLEEQISSMALERAKIEGIHKDKRLSNPDDEYYDNLQKYAMARLSYYTCHKWENPYYGGLKDWGNMLEAAANFNPEELVCGKCAAEELGGQGKPIFAFSLSYSYLMIPLVDCKKHGKDYIEFKCRYCWSLSQWFWFGTTHFCDPCHKEAGRNNVKKCPGKDKCGLKVTHPDNGEEFALGCGLCRNAS